MSKSDYRRSFCSLMIILKLRENSKTIETRSNFLVSYNSPDRYKPDKSVIFGMLVL